MRLYKSVLCDPIRVRPAQRATKSNTTSLADRPMDANAKANPRVPSIQKFSKASPVGVLKPCCTTEAARISRSARIVRSLGPYRLPNIRSAPTGRGPRFPSRRLGWAPNPIPAVSSLEASRTPAGPCVSCRPPAAGIREPLTTAEAVANRLFHSITSIASIVQSRL